MKTARTLFENEEYGPCAFFSHQAAEKALKALLYSKGIKVFGHSLVGLLARATEEGFSEPSNSVKNAAISLDEHYITSRYPDAFESQIPADHYTVGIAEETIIWTHLILEYTGENPT